MLAAVAFKWEWQTKQGDIIESTRCVCETQMTPVIVISFFEIVTSIFNLDVGR